MARKQFLQNVHTTKKYSADVIAEAQLKDGEIAVFQNAEEPSLGIKVGDTYAQFKDASAITAVEEKLQGQIDALNGETLSNYLTKDDASKTYETKTDATTKKNEAITAANAYTNTEIAKLTGNTDGSLQKQISANATAIKTNTDKITELSGGTTAYTNTAVSKAKTDLIGTTADTKDIKTIEGVKKYADSLVTAITGNTDGSIAKKLSEVENKADANATNIGKNSAAITTLQGTDKDTSSSVSITGAKKYADEKIAAAVSSVYRVKGTCTYEELTGKTGQVVGDVWNVTDAHGNVPAGTNYVWAKGEGDTEAKWDALGGTIDLSPYFKTADFNTTLTKDTSFTAVKTTAEAAATKTALAKVEATANAAAVKTEVDNALAAKVAKTDLDTYATKKGIQDALDDKANQSDLEGLKTTVNGLGTALSGHVKIGTTADTKDNLTAYGLQKYAEDVAGTKSNDVKTALEGTTTSTSATTTITGAKKYADQKVATLNGIVEDNKNDISTLTANLKTVSDKTNTAVQTITVTNSQTNKITATKEGTTVTFNFDNMVIDCGEF